MKIFVPVVAPFVCLLAHLCVTLGSDEVIAGGIEQASEKRKPLTPKQCLNVVKKVQKSKKYTEESIAPICREELPAGNCDFFAEALSLASSHSDFKGETFCRNVDRAQFCSEIMDKLLQSTAVSDLAFGECERAKPKKNIEYCRKIQDMLSLSVREEDLDTMRACYMMEAYTNMTASKELEATEPSPKARIITSSSKELDSAGANAASPKSGIISSSSKELDSLGKGEGPGHPPKESNIGRAGIIVQPVPIENFGKGKGNVTSPKPKGIITEPIPANAKAKESSPAILTEPIPANSKASDTSGGSKVGFLVSQPPPRFLIASQPTMQALSQPQLAQPQQLAVVAIAAPVTSSRTFSQGPLTAQTVSQIPQEQLLTQTMAAVPLSATQGAVQTMMLPPLTSAAAPAQVVVASSMPAAQTSKQLPATLPLVQASEQAQTQASVAPLAAPAVVKVQPSAPVAVTQEATLHERKNPTIAAGAKVPTTQHPSTSLAQEDSKLSRAKQQKQKKRMSDYAGFLTKFVTS